MAESSPSNKLRSTIIGRIWHAAIPILLLGLLLLVWADGLTPAVNPLRFLSKLPFPAGNILFACYLIVIYLHLRQSIYADIEEQMNWYRFLLGWGAMGAILQIREVSALDLTWAVALAWCVLGVSAVVELFSLNGHPLWVTKDDAQSAEIG